MYIIYKIALLLCCLSLGRDRIHKHTQSLIRSRALDRALSTANRHFWYFRLPAARIHICWAVRLMNMRLCLF